MENNMKQFNLQEYLAHPERKVVTRDGRPVRIICTDCKVAQPIIAIVNEGRPHMIITSFWKNGRHISNSTKNDLDLFFALTKHEAWINLYRDCSTGGKYPGCRLFNTEKEAKQGVAIKDDRYIATIKIEWKE